MAINMKVKGLSSKTTCMVHVDVGVQVLVWIFFCLLIIIHCLTSKQKKQIDEPQLKFSHIIDFMTL